MNIWVIARSYPIKKNKMRGSFELEQARLLADAGHNVTFLALIFHPAHKVKKWGYCTWKDGDITVCTESVFYPPERMHMHSKLFQGGKWKRFLSRVEKENGMPDVIHIHYPGMVTIEDPVFEYQKKGVAVVVTDHWTKTLMNTMDNFQRKQLVQYAKRADAFLCVGEPLKKAVQEISGTDREIRVVPNVVSSMFQPERSTKDSEKYNFIAVGRLVPHKQFDKILCAFAETFKGQKHITLTIVGGGGEIKTLNELIGKYDVADQVILTGTLSREKTAQRVAQADSLVCYSRLETFGVPVIEAWACGKPVVASNCLGFLEYWRDDLGYVVPWDDLEPLKKAMQGIYEKRNQYDSEKIAQFAQDNFGEKKLCDTLSGIYGQAIERIKARGNL